MSFSNSKTSGDPNGRLATCREGEGNDGVPVEHRCDECGAEIGHDVACLASGSTEVPQALWVRVARALRLGLTDNLGDHADDIAPLVSDLIAAGVWPREVRS